MMSARRKENAMEGLAKLREPFPPDRIGILPKPYKRDSQKGNCNVCGKYHGLPAVHLDYVGHGAVTERLLDVDPEWVWEPMALTDEGLPLVQHHGNTASLWIRLTVLGVTRLGVGTAQSSKDEVLKELIGDAIRNASMRFGVALDLWVKGDKAEGDETADTTPSPEQIAERATNKLKADVIGLVGDKEEARVLYSEAVSNQGFGFDDVIPAVLHSQIMDDVRALYESAGKVTESEPRELTDQERKALELAMKRKQEAEAPFTLEAEEGTE